MWVLLCLASSFHLREEEKHIREEEEQSARDGYVTFEKMSCFCSTEDENLWIVTRLMLFDGARPPRRSLETI